MTCRSRSYRLSAVVVASLLSVPAIANAAELPPIRASETNQVADCATPGRLTVYLRQRNPKLDPRYEGLAGEYKRFGQELNLRWDYAFFQMLLETGYLTYGGDVKPDQNNFAGLGATGKGAHGESFSDISTGARAHLEHLLMYSGARVENPVAERTRNIQEWGVLTKWQASLSGPITFTQLAAKWAPGSRRYATDIQAIADRFFDGVCHDPDPDGAVVAAVDEDRGPPKASTAKETTSQLPPAEEKNSKAVATAAATAIPSGFSKTASNVTLPSKTAAAAPKPPAEKPPAEKSSADKASTAPPVKLLNPEPSVSDAPAATAAGSVEEAAETAKTSGKSVEVAALPGAIGSAGADSAAKKSDAAPQKQGSEKKPEKKAPEKKAEKKDAGAANGKCRVWTASYGGSKAIIIRASADKTTNYTVLDVNEGAEKREADAYINAYAKGGQSVGEFSSQAQALEKAFELCPEG